MAFEGVWMEIRESAELNDTFHWNEEGNFTASVHEHFRNGGVPPEARGVYVLRRIPSRGRRLGRVLYVGKAGTVTTEGGFRGTQGLEKRLCNTRHGGRTANQWTQELLGGPPGGLRVEYAVLQNPRVMSPGLAEARLLQAYLEEYGSLPVHNREL